MHVSRSALLLHIVVGLLLNECIAHIYELGWLGSRFANTRHGWEDTKTL